MALREARYPQVRVLIDGQALAGVIEVQVCSNNHLAANRYSILVALEPDGYDLWTGDLIRVEIRVNLDGIWTTLMVGQVDELDIDVGRKRLRVEGRDLTSRFVEARTQETFENQTASQIALTLSQRRGLQSAVVPTSTVVGRNYQSGFARVTLDQHARSTTEWDLLIQLAEGEGFDVWVDGDVLNFAPPDQAASTILLRPSDCLSIHLRRLLTLSGGLEVGVKSWDCRRQKAVLQTARSVGTSGDVRNYVLVRPNLTDGAAQSLANRLLVQMSQHERSIYIEMPGDITTKPRDLLTMLDTGTDFDGIWTITDVDRRISFQEGFVQVLEARMPAWTAF